MVCGAGGTRSPRAGPGVFHGILQVLWPLLCMTSLGVATLAGRAELPPWVSLVEPRGLAVSAVCQAGQTVQAWMEEVWHVEPLGKKEGRLPRMGLCQARPAVPWGRGCRAASGAGSGSLSFWEPGTQQVLRQCLPNDPAYPSLVCDGQVGTLEPHSPPRAPLTTHWCSSSHSLCLLP